MGLFVHIATSPIGLMVIVFLGLIGALRLYRIKRSVAIKAAYGGIEFALLSRDRFSTLMPMKHYQLLCNRTFAIFRHSRAFAGTFDQRAVVQCLRTKYAVNDKARRLTTVTQVDSRIRLPRFTLDSASVYEINLAGKPQNRLYPTAIEHFSDRYELYSDEYTEVLALFNDSFCGKLMDEHGLRIECHGDRVIVFTAGRRIYNANDVDRFLKRAIRWVEHLEAAQAAAVELSGSALPRAA